VRDLGLPEPVVAPLQDDVFLNKASDHFCVQAFYQVSSCPLRTPARNQLSGHLEWFLVTLEKSAEIGHVIDRLSRNMSPP
jgi:hypothetical protein